MFSSHADPEGRRYTTNVWCFEETRCRCRLPPFDPETFWLYRTSKAVATHINRQAISIVLSTVFGIRAPRFENSFASNFLEIEHTLEGFFEPGAIPPVDILPTLKYIPAFLAPWKSKCSELRKRYQNLFSGLRDMCEARVQNGRRNGCYLEDVLDQQEKLGLSREMIRWILWIIITRTRYQY